MYKRRKEYPQGIYEKITALRKQGLSRPTICALTDLSLYHYQQLVSRIENWPSLQEMRLDALLDFLRDHPKCCQLQHAAAGLAWNSPRSSASNLLKYAAVNKSLQPKVAEVYKLLSLNRFGPQFRAYLDTHKKYHSQRGIIGLKIQERIFVRAAITPEETLYDSLCRIFSPLWLHYEEHNLNTELKALYRENADSVDEIIEIKLYQAGAFEKRKMMDDLFKILSSMDESVLMNRKLGL